MINSVGIIANLQKENILNILRKVSELFLEKEITVYSFQDIKIKGIKKVDEKLFAELSNIVIVFGGDGTLLSSGRKLIEYNKNILPINIGTMGFLAELNFDEFQKIFNDIIYEKYSVERRITLYAKTISEKKFYTIRNVAINEVLISRKVFDKMLKFKVFINDELVANFRADGLIVSTPAGSTGHSLSAGGPVLHPQLSAIIMLPFCAHTLTARPLIIPDTSLIRVEFENVKQNVIVTFDGQISRQIKPNNNILIKKSIYQLNIIKSDLHSFYEILRKKLSWLEQ
ncbi:MAG TPA: NAD(+)/NADH kinase [bacterium]|nr:NAD(+)/NADH kinase [bacterium]HOL47857.1 NAD(+)/NADH kinase [bacterium]HPQ17896.1 NAD(+)/NADH kinase [bacterium]